MGWTYPMHTYSAKAVRDMLLDQYQKPEQGWRVLKHATTKFGRHWWAVIQNPAGAKLVCLFLIRGDKEGWGYKDIDESMGPCEVDCPLELLALADPDPPGYAPAWREEVRAYHAARTATFAKSRGLKPGARVMLKLGRNPRGPFTVTKVDRRGLLGACNGAVYRLPRAAILEVLE